MPEKSIIIIGGGIAGLAAGCYARMNGYRATIFELHTLPGGLCTAWDRKGYIFDGCIHYLIGSGAGQPFNQMWRELGAVQGRPMINHSEYQRVTDGKQTLIVYTDPDKLEAHMCEISPADAGRIHAFCNGIRHFTRFDMSALYTIPRQIMGPLDWRSFGMKMLPFVWPLMRWALLPARAFAAQFKDPFLRRTVAQLFSWEEAPMMMGMALMASMHTGNAGFPVGGSLEFARAVERRFLELGGEICYDHQVEKILVENDRAVGVRLYNNEIHRADYVISASDGRTTIYNMLDAKYINRKIERMYSGKLPMHTQVQVSMGVKRDLSAEPHWVTYLLDQPTMISGEERREVSVKHYCFDPSLAPASKSVLMIMIRSNYEYWQNLFGRRIYDTEQREVSDTFIDLLERWYPGLRPDIEFVDEATPLSYERYTNNWRGSTTGWLLSRETMPMMIMGVKKTLPGLKNFYMAGQWVEPGGMVPLSAASGRTAIQLICHEEGKRFEAREG